MSALLKYPSTNNFRHTVDEILKRSDYWGEPKNIRFSRTVKIHGTNASIVYDLKTRDVKAQSRNRILSLGNDNAGFALWVDTNKARIVEIIQDFLSDYLSPLEEEDFQEYGWSHFVLYGEWFGPGIQKNVAVNKLDSKKFAIFAYCFSDGGEDTHTLNFITDDKKENQTFNNPDIEMYPITAFGYDEVTVDFSDSDKLIKAQEQFLTDAEEVGKNCPVASYFGIDGPGEGHVYVPMSYLDTRIKFKVKSKAHTVSKTKVLSAKDIKRVAEVSDFVKDICTEARLEQGIEYLKEMEIPLEAGSTGDYIRWVVLDTFKEEGDIIEKSGFTEKDVKNALGKISRSFFLNEITSIKNLEAK